MTEMAERKEIVQANPKPCALCPWRLENQGMRHPHGFYSKSNLRRLWAGLRSGNAPGMTCHPTDPHMAEFEGYEATAGRERTHECAGSLVLLARELKKFEAQCKAVTAEEAAGAVLRPGEALRRYRALGPATMTRGGISEFVWRIAVRLPGDIPIPAIPINDPAIGYPPTGEWSPSILEEADRAI